jgi:gliding motility-associated-like protein
MINFKNTLTLGAMFLTQSFFAQTPIGITVHDGGSIYFHGDANNNTAAIDQNSKAIVTRVLGTVEVGATDADAAKIGSTDKGEVWIEGSGLVRRKSGTADWKGDVVMNNPTTNQSILGGFENTNKFENLISNKNSNLYVDMNNNVEVENKFVFANSGYVRTDVNSGISGMDYAAKLKLNSTSTSAINGSPSLGFKNYIVEGKLERNTTSGLKYVFPMSIDLNNTLGGAQIAEVSVAQGNGFVLGAFTKDGGVDKTLNLTDNNCSEVEVNSVVDHGFWTLENPTKDVKSFAVTLKAHSIIDKRPEEGNIYTIVKKDHKTASSTYKLLGLDANSCSGYESDVNSPNIDEVARTSFTSFSDFAIAPIVKAQGDLPNYITPNGDGKNDKFVIPAAYFAKYPNLKVAIYNRWGNIVWRSEGTYKNDWDGVHQINNEPLPDGVYYYIFELDKEFAKTKTGFIQINRD